MDNHKKAIETAIELIKSGEISRETAEKIFPELRESEDERIRKEIISLVLKVMGQEKDNLSDDKYNAMLAWLEKKKEQKEDLIYRLNGLMQDYIKEGKNDEEKEHRLKCYQLFWDALEDTSCFEQKEQKPIDANHIVNAILSALSSGLETDEILKARGFTYDNVEEWLNSTRNPAIEYIRGQNKIFDNPEQYGLCKKPDWSEEDKLWLSEVYFAIDHSMYSETERQAMKKYIDYLRYQSQPKPTEWSEEDERMLHEADIAVVGYYRHSPKYFPKDKCKHIRSWLKSLRPQPKQEWSEEDKANLNNIIWLCENCEKGIENVWIPSQATQIKNLIKSLRPSWKPSDKQMKALQSAKFIYKDGLDNSAVASILESLYNDLLKLK